MKTKKVKFIIQGTAYIDEKYKQEDMVAYNISKVIPSDIIDAIKESIFNRKRSYHLSIVGDKSFNWKEEYLRKLQELENLHGHRMKIAVLSFLRMFNEEAYSQKFYIIKDILSMKVDPECIITAIDKTIQNKKPSIKYMQAIAYSQQKQIQKQSDTSNNIIDKSKELLDKFRKYA